MEGEENKSDQDGAAAADNNDSEETKTAASESNEPRFSRDGDSNCNPIGTYMTKMGVNTAFERKQEMKKKVPSEDEKLAWVKDVDHTGNSYLVLVNHAGKTIKAGEQIMFYYGRFTNAYLLLNYGFCYRDNRFD